MSRNCLYGVCVTWLKINGCNADRIGLSKSYHKGHIQRVSTDLPCWSSFVMYVIFWF